MDYAIAKRCCLQQIAIDFLKDSDPILGRLIDQIGACQLNEYELEGDLLCMPIPVNSPPTTFYQGG
jgi:hypothetical protein